MVTRYYVDTSIAVHALMGTPRAVTWFDEVTGVVLGDFSEAADPIDDVVHERLEPLGVPIVEGAAIGHEALNLAVPLGLPVRLDATAGTLTPSGLAGR